MQPLRDFLEIPYDQLEEMNLAAKAERVGRKDPGKIREARMKWLNDEKRVKALTEKLLAWNQTLPTAP